MLRAQLRNTFSADATVNGDAVDTDHLEGVTTLMFEAQYKPVGSAPTGTTINFDCKLQHSVDNVTFIDVAGGAITQILVGTEARDSVRLAIATVELFRWVRIVGITSIVGSPNYQTGTELIARVKAA